MPGAHRHGDNRICGATTTVVGQSTVFVENKLFSVEGDTDTHSAGALIASGSTVFVNGKKVIILGDHANPDVLCFTVGAPHCDPYTVTASGTVSVYG